MKKSKNLYKRMFSARINILIIISFFILHSSLIIGEIRYVSKTGSSTPPYTSWATAADSIQKCINISNYGDTIFVGAGIYKDTAVMIQGLSLIGMGADSCIIDLTHRTDVVRAIQMKDSCLFKGFKLKFSIYNSQSGGVWTILQESVKGCIISDNIFENASSAIVITDGMIKKNIIVRAHRGITCWENDQTQIFKIQIDSNYISFEFEGIRPISTGYIDIYARNNIFNIETLLSAEILYNALTNSTTPEFKNNVIIQKYNSVNNRGIVNVRPGNFINNLFLAKFNHVFYTSSTGVKIVNNNIIGSKNAVYGNPEVKYNNFWQVETYPPDSTNISVYPMFVNEDSLDFHLQMNSPLIDAGDPEILDKDGSRSDIGLYGGPYGESYTYRDLAPRIPVNVTAILDSEYITIKWNKNYETDFRGYNIYRDTVSGFIPGENNLLTFLEDTTYTESRPEGISRLYYKITSIDDQGNESNTSSEVSVILIGIKEYPQIISGYQMYPNYPNPFNSTTRIGYRLSERGYVKVYVYDLTGSIIETLVNEEKESGYYETEFKAREELASGIYLYKINITESRRKIPVFTEIGKMLLIK